MTLKFNSASTKLLCPLCSNTVAKVIESVSFDQIWFGLTKGTFDVFHKEVIKRHTPSKVTNLMECSKCGLQYFNPAVPGDSEFYKLLTNTSSAYYNEDKWDFHAALDFVEAGNELLDIACGGGAWLHRAQTKGAVVCGIDTNPSAVENAHSAGLQAYCVPLEHFALNRRGDFDIVTAFQVVEHISDVLPFLEAAKTCLKPGGKLIVTVPNRLRYVREQFEPLDHPPHHISRWSAQQFLHIENVTGLKLKSVRFETATMSECRTALRNKVAPIGYTESLWARALGRIFFSPSLYQIYRRIGLLNHWRLWRMSMMAVFEKSELS